MKWRLSMFLVFIVMVASCFSIYTMQVHFEYPILDLHGFRQTQTAISVYWMLHEGHFLAYQTPVLGYPWSIPFEFPLYQWLVFLVCKLGFFPLDPSGRFVSIICFYLTLLPIYFLAKSFRLGLRFYLVFVALYLLSPVYLFWSRTFMPESISLFLAIWFLALVQSYLNYRRWWYFLMATLIGAFGAMVKVTTFLPFELTAVILIIFDWLRTFGFRVNKVIFLKYSPTIFFGMIPFLALFFWTNYADFLKAQSVLGASLVSSKLVAWNFGSLKLRGSLSFWGKIAGRSMSQAIGPGVFLIYACLLSVFRRHSYAKAAGVLFVLYLSGFLIFANLHYIHSYYDYENTVFLIGMCAILLEILLVRGQTVLAILILFVTLVAQLGVYFWYYRPISHLDTFQDRAYQVGRFVSERTPTDGMIFVYGNDWSSSIAYYSERKSVTYPAWESYAPASLENWRNYTGGLRVVAVVICKEPLPVGYRVSPDRLNHLTAGMNLGIVQDCEIYYKDRKTS